MALMCSLDGRGRIRQKRPATFSGSCWRQPQLACPLPAAHCHSRRGSFYWALHFQPAIRLCYTLVEKRVRSWSWLREHTGDLIAHIPKTRV